MCHELLAEDDKGGQYRGNPQQLIERNAETIGNNPEEAADD